MSCRKIRRSLSRYFKGELTTKGKELVDQHIQVCEGCARDAKGYRALDDVISGLDRFEPSPAFESKLGQKIREVSSVVNEPKVKSLFTIFPSLKWAFVPAAVVALALFLILKGGFHKSQTISEKPETLIPQETLLVKAPFESNQEVPSQLAEFPAEKSSDEARTVSFAKDRKSSQRAVFVMDNLRLSDIEEMPDSRLPQRGSAYFVIDAVNYRPVDNRQTNVGYILPAVSTVSSKVRKVY
jgi:hypothetical protein